MDCIVEIIFEIIFEGMIEAAGSKRVPLAIRIVLGTILTLAYLALLGLLVLIAVRSGTAAAIVVATLVLFLGIGLTVKLIRKYHNVDEKTSLL